MDNRVLRFCIKFYAAQSGEECADVDDQTRELNLYDELNVENNVVTYRFI